MSLLKDKKIIALMGVLTVFTISYFIVITNFSHAFSNNVSNEESYKVIIDTIKKCSLAYAKKNPDIFSEENTAYIKVQDLIDNNYLVPNESGIINNPTKENESLNMNMIKLKKEKDEITVEVDG